MDKIQLSTKEFIKKDIPKFGSGDTLSVDVRVREGSKERIQKFEGVVIARHGGCLLYTSPSPRDATLSRMPSSA